MDKEQQKQHLIDMMKADEELGLYDETIIQAKYRFYKEYWNEDHTQLVKSNFLNGFEEGAKWQQERMYSEEEVIAFGEFIFKHSLLTHTRGVKSLFEQFKNK
jgi:hypothetical protein